LGILVNTELDVLAESLVELGEVVLVLSNLADKIEGLLDKVFTDNLEDLILLESLTRDIEGKIFRVDDTLDKVEVLGDEVLAVVHDEDATDVKLDVVALLLGLEKIEGRTADVNETTLPIKLKYRNLPLGNEKNGLEFELTLNGEMLDGEVVFPIIGQTLVESAVFFGCDIRGIASPDRLRLVELFERVFDLLDLFCLLLLLLFVLVDLLDLGILALLHLLLLVFDLLHPYVRTANNSISG
jgi:hypothetical protein